MLRKGKIKFAEYLSYLFCVSDWFGQGSLRGTPLNRMINARREQNESFSNRCPVVNTFSGHTIYSKRLIKPLFSYEKWHELVINGEVFWQQTQILTVALSSKLINRSAPYNETILFYAY